MKFLKKVQKKNLDLSSLMLEDTNFVKRQQNNTNKGVRDVNMQL